MSDQEQKPLPVVSEWALEEVKAHCEAIQRDGKATTIRRVKFYAFLENQTWGPGSIEAALYALYPNQFSPSSGANDQLSRTRCGAGRDRQSPQHSLEN